MKERIRLFKVKLKRLAKDIKYQKSIRKPSHKKHYDYRGSRDLSWKYRHMHVAYCLLRGRTLEQCDSGKGLDMTYVTWMMDLAKDENRAKLYVCIDEKLSDAQKAVQGAHAVGQFLMEHPYTLWQNGTLVLIKDKYGSSGPYGYAAERSSFREPDMKNVVTATASFGPSCETYFKTYKLI